MPSHNIPSRETIKALQDNEVITGYARKGRRPHDWISRTSRETLRSAALPAARLLREFVIGKRVKKMSRTRLDACIFVIEQVLGKAKITVEHDVDNLTYDALVKLATEKQKLLEAGTLIEGEFREVSQAGYLKEGKNAIQEPGDEDPASKREEKA